MNEREFEDLKTQICNVKLACDQIIGRAQQSIEPEKPKHLTAEEWARLYCVEMGYTFFEVEKKSLFFQRIMADAAAAEREKCIEDVITSRCAETTEPQRIGWNGAIDYVVDEIKNRSKS
jgi:hypothetical protein